jgi:Family of unknown function (DUF6325)
MAAFTATTLRRRARPWRQSQEDPMAEPDTTTTSLREGTIDEMGPIDYVVIEWPGEQPQGDVAPLLLDLVDRGIIRILDLAFMAKDENGSVYALEIGELEASEAFGPFDGAASGLLGTDDLEEAAKALEPGTSAVVLVWENRWAAPVAVALRKSGGQLVASGRIPVQAVIASLDALEAGD